jgi:hypothetical protein
MNKNSLLGILALVGLASLTVLSIFLSNKQSLTQKRTLVNKAAETTQTDVSRQMTFAIPDDVVDFPVLNFPTPGGPSITPIPNGGEPMCLTGSNSNKEWMLWDLANDYPVCGDTDNTSTYCPGADLAKESQSARFCYWKDEKKFNLGINTQAMKYKGCYINRDQDHIDFPGSYSTYLMWRPNFRKDYSDNLHFHLDLLQNLQVQTKLSTDYYSQSVCPLVPEPTIPAPQLTQFPYYGGDQAVQHAFFYFSFVATNNALGRAIFYQPQPWDNRYENYFKDGKDPKDYLNETTYRNCKFGKPEWFVISEPIGVLGAEYARPGKGLVSYNVDILPRLKYWINQCMNEYYHTNKDYDLTGWTIGGLNFGNEEGNTPIMTNTIVDPKILTTIKSDVNINSLSTTEPQSVDGRKVPITSATASADNGNTADRAIDNNIETDWHSGKNAAQWIELDLQNRRSVTGLQFRLNQWPNGYSRWKIYGGLTANPTTVIKEVDGITRGREWITITLDTIPNIRYIRVEAVQSPSHISLFEVNVYESTATPTPTQIPSATPTPICKQGFACMTQNGCLQVKGYLSSISCGTSMYCCYVSGAGGGAGSPVTIIPVKPSPTVTIRPFPTIAQSSSCPAGFSCRSFAQCRALGGGASGISCGQGMFCCYGK